MGFKTVHLAGVVFDRLALAERRRVNAVAGAPLGGIGRVGLAVKVLGRRAVARVAWLLLRVREALRAETERGKGRGLQNQSHQQHVTEPSHDRALVGAWCST